MTKRDGSSSEKTKFVHEKRGKGGCDDENASTRDTCIILRCKGDIQADG